MMKNKSGGTKNERIGSRSNRWTILRLKVFNSSKGVRFFSCFRVSNVPQLDTNAFAKEKRGEHSFQFEPCVKTVKMSPSFITDYCSSVHWYGPTKDLLIPGAYELYPIVKKLPAPITEACLTWPFCSSWYRLYLRSTCFHHQLELFLLTCPFFVPSMLPVLSSWSLMYTMYVMFSPTAAGSRVKETKLRASWDYNKHLRKLCVR